MPGEAEQSGAEKGGSRRVLPNPSVCRTRPLGALQSLGACMVEEPNDCPYALPAIGGNFCSHPNWKGFAMPAGG